MKHCVDKIVKEYNDIIYIIEDFRNFKTLYKIVKKHIHAIDYISIIKENKEYIIGTNDTNVKNELVSLNVDNVIITNDGSSISVKFKKIKGAIICTKKPLSAMIIWMMTIQYMVNRHHPQKDVIV
jgi:recombinational DNA repair protein RecR